MDLLAFFIPGLFAVEENLRPKEALYAAIILAFFFIWFLIACKPWQKTPEEKQKKRKNHSSLKNMDYCFVSVVDSIFLPSMVKEEMDSLNAIIPNLFPN